MKYDDILEKVEGLAETELIELNNLICEEFGISENMIYDMDEFDDCMYGVAPSDLARWITDGEFNPTDYYFRQDEWDDLVSDDNPFNLIDTGELTDQIIDGKEDFSRYGIGRLKKYGIDVKEIE